MRSNLHTFSLTLLAVLVLLMAAPLATAQETQPGDACTLAGAFQRSGGPEITGGGHLMVCDGANWISMLDYADSGRTLLQVDNDTGPCTATKDGRIRYISSQSPPWEYCDGGATTWLPFKQPRCQDDDTGECYLQATRSNDDPEFLAANIKCDVNILGIVGTLGTDVVPDAFIFTDLTNQPLNTLIVSNATQITGFDCTLAVTLSGDGSPEFRICTDSNCTIVDRPWSAAAATITTNKFLQLRLTTPGTSNTLSTADTFVAGVTDAWDVTTCDTEPVSFAFIDLADQPRSTTVYSDILQITGINCASDVSISGTFSGRFRICNDATCTSVDHVWGNAAQTIDNNQYLQLRLTTSNSYSISRTATPSVGGITDNWSATTECDNNPSSFSFTDLTSQPESTLIASNIIQITGIGAACPSDVSISGDGSPESRICSNSDCSTIVYNWGAAGQQINNNQYLQVRLTTAATDWTLSIATPNVGGVIDTWSVSTTGVGCDPLSGTTTYTTAGLQSYVVPTGCNSVTVGLWAGGAGGKNGGLLNGGDAGGGGAYSADTIAVIPGNSYDVMVGSPGSSDGGAGGDSYFINAATLLAKGGTLTTGGQAASGVGTTKFSGGNGGAGGFAFSGTGGGGAGSAANGSDGSAGGAGGAPDGGNGGGGAGQQPGGGGGGANGWGTGPVGGIGKAAITPGP